MSVITGGLPAFPYPSQGNCSSGPGLITGYGGHPTAYGFGYRAHLHSLAAASY